MARKQCKQQHGLEKVEEILARFGVAGDADWMAVVLFVRNLVTSLTHFTEDQKADIQARVFEEMGKKPLTKESFAKIIARLESFFLESPRVQDLRDKLKSEQDAFNALYDEMGRVFTEIKSSNMRRQTNIVRLGEHTEQAIMAAPDRSNVVRQLRGMLTEFVAQAREEARGWEERAKQLERTANFDPLLSELYSRRAFDAQLAEVADRCAREGKPLSLMFIDVDRFKAINDTQGHMVGDGVLRVLAAIVSAHALQFSGYAARYGGEELVVLCEDMDEGTARLRAEAIRADVQRCPFAAKSDDQKPGADIRVTVSIGVAQMTPHRQSTGDLVLAADNAMYAAKGRGRNTVVVASEMMNTRST